MVRADGELARLAASLNAFSPLAALTRGYAVVKRLPDKKIVRAFDQAPVGTEIDITLSQGELRCTVNRATGEVPIKK